MRTDDNKDAKPSDLLTFEPLLIIPANSDIRLVGTSDVNNTQLSGAMRGWLASVVA